jgi:energy-coupling factor transporter transmembrane protein EcfT
MAGQLAFHYFPGRSLFHRWDARCKLPGLFILTLSLVNMGWESLGLFSVILAGAVYKAGIPFRAMLKEARSWGFFLLIIFLVQALFTPGNDTSAAGNLSFSLESLHAGGITVWRLALILAFAALFTSVTKPGDLQNAILWFLRPFPFLPARKIALMVTLTLRFLPLILDQAEEIRTATRARLGNASRNPLRRAKLLVLPLVRRSLLRADDIALALAARGYSEDLPLNRKPLPISHVCVLVGFAAFAACTSGETAAAIGMKVQDILNFVNP